MRAGRGATQDGSTVDGGYDCPLDCGQKKPEPEQQMPQPCPHKLRATALAKVLMRMAESCVIEQHISNLFEVVEPTNLGLGTPDAAALILRIARGWHLIEHDGFARDPALFSRVQVITPRVIVLFAEPPVQVVGDSTSLVTLADLWCRRQPMKASVFL